MAHHLTPGNEPRAVGGDVHFSLTIDGVVQRYVISREALADHFDPEEARAQDPLAAFSRGENRILAVAAAKLGAGTGKGNSGHILLGTFDFR